MAIIAELGTFLARDTAPHNGHPVGQQPHDGELTATAPGTSDTDSA